MSVLCKWKIWNQEKIVNQFEKFGLTLTLANEEKKGKKADIFAKKFLNWLWVMFTCNENNLIFNFIGLETFLKDFQLKCKSTCKRLFREEGHDGQILICLIKSMRCSTTLENVFRLVSYSPVSFEILIVRWGKIWWCRYWKVFQSTFTVRSLRFSQSLKSKFSNNSKRVFHSIQRSEKCLLPLPRQFILQYSRRRYFPNELNYKYKYRYGRVNKRIDENCLIIMSQ